MSELEILTDGPEVEADSAEGAAAAARRRADHDRRVQRRGRYDQIAERRAEWQARNHFYQGEVRRVVASLVTPRSRVLEVGCGLGDLLAGLGASRAVGLDVSSRMIELARARHPELELFVADAESDPLPAGPFDYVVLSDVVGHLEDVELTLRRLHEVLAPQGRVVLTYYNFLWEPLLDLAAALGRKTPWPAENWLSMADIENLLRLADFEVIRRGTDVLVPVDVAVVAPVANRLLAKAPGLRHGALVSSFVARSAPTHPVAPAPTVSVICPCRNERGNVFAAVHGTPVMGPATEFIFVDGGSDDGTVAEIERAIRGYRGPLTVRLVHQGSGRGKGDAVRKGFAAARHDVLMILDADLTVAPTDLPKFYRALVHGKGELINGVRLVYPMEGEAMRFLNRVGNKFFSVALSWILEQPIKDSLCGTKVLYRVDYERLAAHRDYFGDFDPFGDFDLLFGAARLNLKIVDLPVRYRARTYGDTKIDRFAHGWRLLKMTAFGLRKLRL